MTTNEFPPQDAVTYTQANNFSKIKKQLGKKKVSKKNKKERIADKSVSLAERLGTEKTYMTLREELDDPQSLQEFRMLRGGAALVFANKAKTSGDKLVRNAQRGKGILGKTKPDSTPDDRLNNISQALEVMFECLIDGRVQVGNLVGISLASALISERSTKELTKILKQRR